MNLTRTDETDPGGAVVVDRFRRVKVVPVIVIESPDHAVPLAEALGAGGLSVVEITLRTPTAVAALRRITTSCPDIFAGAGTVLHPDDAARARDAGARFIVAPGFSPPVVDYCLKVGIPVFPGVCTPTEIEAALQHGLSVLKFFPAEAIGGLPYLQAIAAPYRTVEFIPFGGVNLTNLAPYLAFKRVVACGGSWIAPSEWIAAKQFDRIRAEAEKAVAAARAGERAGPLTAPLPRGGGA